MENYFENVINGLEVSRIIGSWLRSGGTLTGSYRKDKKFVDWVSHLNINGRIFTEEEVMEIYHCVQGLVDGKLELEVSAEQFLKEGA